MAAAKAAIRPTPGKLAIDALLEDTPAPGTLRERCLQAAALAGDPDVIITAHYRSDIPLLIEVFESLTSGRLPALSREECSRFASVFNERLVKG